LDRTGYSLDVSTGQRRYGGPPPNWNGPQPGPGHEVLLCYSTVLVTYTHNFIIKIELLAKAIGSIMLQMSALCFWWL